MLRYLITGLLLAACHASEAPEARVAPPSPEVAPEVTGGGGARYRTVESRCAFEGLSDWDAFGDDVGVARWRSEVAWPGSAAEDEANRVWCAVEVNAPGSEHAAIGSRLAELTPAPCRIELNETAGPLPPVGSCRVTLAIPQLDPDGDGEVIGSGGSEWVGR